MDATGSDPLAAGLVGQALTKSGVAGELDRLAESMAASLFPDVKLAEGGGPAPTGEGGLAQGRSGSGSGGATASSGPEEVKGDEK